MNKRWLLWGLVLLCSLALPGCLAQGELIIRPVEDHELLEQTQEPGEMPEAETLTISATGDVTLGGNYGKNSSEIYMREYEKQGGNYGFPFRNVRDLLAEDDMTLVNFEGTLTDSTKPGNNNSYRFRIAPEHVQGLTLGSVEAVALENNHVMDFGQQGYEDTMEALRRQNIVYSTSSSMGVYEVKGVSIAMLSYQTFNGGYERIYAQMPQAVADAKAKHDLVIVSYHWGEEGDYKPHDRQIALGRATVDAGADLVLGHHSHRINPIEYYNGKYIVYSLANFSFSGNVKPSDMNTFVFQIRYAITPEGLEQGPFRVIPMRISSVSDTNDFAPTPYAPGSAEAQKVLDKLLENGKGLKYAVEVYPTEWPD